jgi:hypothetical protein
MRPQEVADRREIIATIGVLTVSQAMFAKADSTSPVFLRACTLVKEHSRKGATTHRR